MMKAMGQITEPKEGIASQGILEINTADTGKELQMLGVVMKKKKVMKTREPKMEDQSQEVMRNILQAMKLEQR